jgi:hypothetical protein
MMTRRNNLTGPMRPFRDQAHMRVIENQSPEPRQARRRHAWAEWLIMTLALASAWCGVCALVQLAIG